MTQIEFVNLGRGDIIKSKFNDKTFIIDANYGNRITAVKTVDLTNPIEWDLIMKAKYF